MFRYEASHLYLWLCMSNYIMGKAVWLIFLGTYCQYKVPLVILTPFCKAEMNLSSVKSVDLLTRSFYLCSEFLFLYSSEVFKSILFFIYIKSNIWHNKYSWSYIVTQLMDSKVCWDSTIRSSVMRLILMFFTWFYSIYLILFIPHPHKSFWQRLIDLKM